MSQHQQAVKKLAAMAHESRLSLLRFLISRGPSGATAGEIAAHAELAPSTTSVQLTVLANASLVSVEREGRNMIYRPAFDDMTDLLMYLMEDCCCGRSEICQPLSDRSGQFCQVSETGGINC